MPKRFRLKSLALVAAAGCALAGPAREARATLAIAFEMTFGATTVRNFAVDNGVLAGYVPSAGYVQVADTDPAVGVLALGTFSPFPGYTVSGSMQTQTVASGPGALNVLDTSALSVTNNTGGTVTTTAAVAGTNFTGPVTQAQASGSITWENAVGASISGSWVNDAANGQGAENSTDLPGFLIHSWLASANSLADADSTASGPVAVNDPALFSMGLGFTLTTSDADAIPGNNVFARVVNRGQTQVTVVPEPSSLALVGVGLLGVLGCGSRRAAR